MKIGKISIRSLSINCRYYIEKIIDPEILGGIYVRIGNDIIDGTVKTRLEDLKKLMLTTE